MEACLCQASRYPRDADYERHAFVRQALHAGAAELEGLAERLRASIARNGRAQAGVVCHRTAHPREAA
jgi:hypothetical protein